MKNGRIAFGAAQHEAGHSFLRWLLGYGIKFVTVGESNTECFVRYQTRDLKESTTDLICACSGFAAESVAGIIDEGEWLDSADRHRAFAIATQLSGGDAQAAAALVNCAYRMAIVILSAQEPTVQRLADALETDRTLSGEQVSAILEREQRNALPTAQFINKGARGESDSIGGTSGQDGSAVISV